MRVTHRHTLAALAIPAVVLAVLVPSAAPATAQRATGTMGQLTTILPDKETDGAWTVETTAAGFRMTNRAEPNAVRYFYVDAGNAPGTRTVTVDVSIEPRGPRAALAGLLYGFDANSKTYFMLVVENSEHVALYRRGPQGMTRLAQAKLDSVSGGPYRLSVAEDGETVALGIDGKSLGKVKTSKIIDGSTGIIAAGLGTFAFSGFSISTEGGTAR